MRLIFAVIKPFKLDAVTAFLAAEHADIINALEVKGFSLQKTPSRALYRGAEYKCDFLPQVLVIALVEDNKVDLIKRAIADSARTGRTGDGIIWDIAF